MKPLDKFRKIIEELGHTLLEREEHVKALAVALLAGENVFMIGAPGQAKSMLFREFFKRVTGANYFERLLTKTTVPEEIFGPVDLPRYTEKGEFVRNTDGMLPTAHFAFLDEPGKSSSAILNTLLTIMNEHLFHNGPCVEECPLRMVGAASNEFFDTGELDALYDRFAIKLETKPLVRDRMKLLVGPKKNGTPTTISIEELEELREACARAISTPERIFKKALRLQDKLKEEGITVSDRTLFKLVADKDRAGEPRANLVKAMALLAGRDKVLEDDLTIFRHVVWKTIEEKEKAEEIIWTVANPFTKKAKEFTVKATELHKEATSTTETDVAYEKHGEIQDMLEEIEQILDDPTFAIQHHELKKAQDVLTRLSKEILEHHLNE